MYSNVFYIMDKDTIQNANFWKEYVQVKILRGTEHGAAKLDRNCTKEYDGSDVSKTNTDNNWSRSGAALVCIASFKPLLPREIHNSTSWSSCLDA